VDDPTKYAKYIEEADVIIDTVTIFTAPGKCNQDLLQAVVEAGKKTNSKKTLIYTSGVLVYGDNPGKVLTEEDEPKPGPMVQWRVALG